jgi:hypothetical protein
MGSGALPILLFSDPSWTVVKTSLHKTGFHLEDFRILGMI